MTYQLYDATLELWYGPKRAMTAEQALVANRDLRLSGNTMSGWKAVPTMPKPTKPTKPKKVPVVRAAPIDGLVDSLVALGHTTTEARKLAAPFTDCTVEEALREIYHAA